MEGARSGVMPWLLLLARVVAAGALVLAGVMKLGFIGGSAQAENAPLVFALSLQSFKLLPDALVPVVTYFVPWCEVVAGGLMLLGVWSRQSGAVAAGMLLVFTLALGSVLVRGLPVECGCFGGLFGETKVTWANIAHNLVLAACAVAVAIAGGGALALKPDETHPHQ